MRTLACGAPRRHVALAILLWLACGIATAGTIRQCRDAEGRASWTDRPCPADARETDERASSAQAGGAGPASKCASPRLGWQDRHALRAFDLAALPPKQRMGLMGLLPALTASPKRELRWLHAASGDLHLCFSDQFGTNVELVLTADGAQYRHAEGRSERLDDLLAPTAVLAACAARMLLCLARDDPPSIDRCVVAIARCGRTGAEQCCPDACQGAYRSARAGGEDPGAASERVLFATGSCIPGLDALRGRRGGD